MHRGLLLLALLGAPLAACGSDSGAAEKSPGSGGGGSSPVLTISAPPEVEQRMAAIAEEIRRAVCPKSQACCGQFGFEPLQDCRGYAGGLLTARAFSVAIGARGEQGLIFAINEYAVQRCLSAVRASEPNCSMTKDEAWSAPCESVLQVAEKGEPFSECNVDSDCEFIAGKAGSGCLDHRCVPKFEVGSGESCLAESAALPTCSAGLFCDYSQNRVVCAPKAATGALCSAKEACSAGDFCATSTCKRLGEEGASCHPLDEPCADGLNCLCQALGCPAPGLCVRARALDEPCTADAECAQLSRCTQGKCKLRTLAFCKLPTAD